MTLHSGTITTPLPRRRRAGGLTPKRITVLLALLAIAAVAGYVAYTRIWSTGGKPAASYTASTVTRQTVSSTVSVSGTASAEHQVKLSFAVDGRVSTLSVKQGDTVQQGQVIATLDPTDLQIKRDTVQSQLASAQATLRDLQNGTRPADLAAQQQAVASAQASLTNVQNTLNNLLTGSTAADVAAAKATLDSARAALAVAQANYDKLVSGQDLTQRSEYTALQSAKAAYQTALTNYNAKLNPNPADVAAAQASVSSAQGQLDAAKAKYQSIFLGGSPAAIAAAQASVDAAQAALNSAMAKRAALSGDTTVSESDYAAADAAVLAAQSALTTAKSNLDNLKGEQAGPNIAVAEQSVHAAESALTTAQGNLDKLIHPSADDRAQVQAALNSARAALDTAQANWDRILNKTDLDKTTEATALKAAQASHDNALATYTTKTAAPKAGDVQTAQANVASATAGLAAAQAKLAQLQAGTSETDLVKQQQAVRQLELALQSAQSDLDNVTLTAPFAGTVVSVGVSAGDRAAELTTVVTMLDPNLMRVDATLDESNVAKVKAGQQASITFDAVAGKTFTGQVAVVTPLGTSSSGVVTYPLTLTFDPQGVTVPAGASATAKIVVAAKENALTVPSRAVTHSGNTTTVNVVKDDGTLESRTVQVGITGDDNQVEIVSGLNEGEKVAITATTQTTSTTSTFGAGTTGGPAGGPPPGP